MAIDFNNDYTILTDRGRCAVLLFHYVGDMSQEAEILNNGNIQYKGRYVSDLTIEYEASVVSGAVYRFNLTPSMGEIEILKPDGTSFQQITTIESINTGTTNNTIISLDNHINNNSWAMGGNRDNVYAHIIAVILDDNDNALFTVLAFAPLVESAAYNPNDANSFGFISAVNPQVFSFTKAQNSLISNFSSTEWANILTIWREDPYEPGGTSGQGGGTGTFDGTGDAISFPSLPTLSAVSTGFVTLYAPTLTQLNALASYMWSGGFDIDTFRKLFADPMDVILGLSIVPVAVPISGSQDVKVGNISTGVSMNKASTQYVNVDCGTLQVKEYWGSCLDYAPNSKCQIYLPYIGTRSIDIDEIMGKTIQVKYAVDILSGALVANIMCGSSVLYSFSGACASSIPVVSRDFTSIISSAINIAGSIGMAVATGGLSTPVTAASAVQLGVAAGQTAMNVANSKPSVQHSGAAGGTSGMLAVQTPYLIFELPRQSLPQGYNTFGGYPANITLQLGSCTGFTKVEMIHLENIPATDTELNEIETLLKAGVIL